MANKFYTDIQMGSGTSIINIVADPRATAPSSPTEGQIYYNTVDNLLYSYNGATWDVVGGIGDITAVLTPTGSALSGGGSSGSITLQVVVDNSTIEVSTNSIQIKDSGVTFAKLSSSAYTDNITGSSSTKLTTENAVVTYVASAIADIGVLIGSFDASTATDFPTAPGGTNKGDYWRVSNSGLNPSVVHGEELSTGDVLIAAINNPNVTTTTDWIFLNMNINQATETVAGIAEIATQAESDAGTDDTKIITPLKLKTTLDTRVGGYAATFGNGSSTSFVVTHNLGTLDVVVQLVEVSNGDTIYADVARTTINSVTLTFAVAPSTNQFRVIIKK